MITTQQLRRGLVSAAVISIVSTVSIACSNRLRDYTQLTLKATADNRDTELTADTLDATKSILEKRLTELNLDAAELETAEPDQLIVRLPQEAAVDAVSETLTRVGQLTLRSQKPDTEDELAQGIETLQRLLVEQNTLQQTDKLTEADALQAQIDEARAELISLFEPGEITGEMLLDAQAVQITGFNTWEVRIWLDSQGTALFAEQTKAIAGTGRAIGIFLDDVLLSAPVVDVTFADSGIEGGEASISGNFTQQAAEALEIQLKSGALPLDLAVTEIVSSDDPTE
ncbi:MAG: hypothetical protein AAFP20_12510 [Cyanobacteria bacterium J06614_10]